MTLPKKEFFQGEKIDAKLDFSNDDPKALYTFIFLYECSWNSLTFLATDSEGKRVTHPLLWHQVWDQFNHEYSHIEWYTLGKYSRIQAVNEGVRFDKPGTYTIFAEARLSRKGSSTSKPDEFRIVSDKTTITILSLPPEKEKAMIADALAKIRGRKNLIDPALKEGLSELIYLQTPAARDELISLLPTPELNYVVGKGLLGAPNPPAEAEKIRAAVLSGKLILTEDIVNLYAELELWNTIQKYPVTEDVSKNDVMKNLDDLFNKFEISKKELVEAVIHMPGAHGPIYIEDLWIAFKEMVLFKFNSFSPDLDGGAARCALVEHQLELPPEHVKELLDWWDQVGSADFLPLVRREAAQVPCQHVMALLALAELKPDEARPKIIEDLKCPDSNFLLLSIYAGAPVLEKMAPMPLKELDSAFRAKLSKAKDSPDTLMAYIRCFGSDSLLPDVVKGYQTHGRDWSWETKKYFFAYWMRCDPKNATAEMGKKIQSGGSGTYIFPQPDTSYRAEDYLPLAGYVLQCADSDLMQCGIRFLERHGKESEIDSAIQAVGRLQTSPEGKELKGVTAADLLKSKRWHYTAEQRKRLEAFAAAQ